ncbi:DUF6415 family natural product biosynthesis protein [Streptomyces sp. NBC_00838]|uniref:DUF6415 family natural product biosynthesis protein n=1 Tax=Streptomyces sp. NBC_00838 TaxID=2903680 RepID=UPI003870C80B|nr:DUF6415 family natural product biosynthesis protein [Streptomyces sp. NBC_00838]
MHSSSMVLAETIRPTAPLVERWSPPLDSEGLARIASLLRQVKPLEAIVDDVGDVLGDQDPCENEFGEIAERLRGDLLRLVAIANAAGVGDGDAEVCRLLQRAHTLRSEALPAVSRKALGHLRRMAGVVNDLLERLVETNIVKEVV